MWDLAFFAQAIMSYNLNEYKPMFRKAHEFVKESEVVNTYIIEYNE